MLLGEAARSTEWIRKTTGRFLSLSASDRTGGRSTLSDDPVDEILGWSEKVHVAL